MEAKTKRKCGVPDRLRNKCTTVQTPESSETRLDRKVKTEKKKPMKKVKKNQVKETDVARDAKHPTTSCANTADRKVKTAKKKTTKKVKNNKVKETDVARDTKYPMASCDNTFDKPTNTSEEKRLTDIGHRITNKLGVPLQQKNQVMFGPGNISGGTVHMKLFINANKTVAQVNWHTNGTVSGQNVQGQFVFYTAEILRRQKAGMNIEDIDITELANCYKASQQQRAATSKKLALLTGKPDSADDLPIFDKICSKCNSAATMTCGDCDMLLCDNHDEAVHRMKGNRSHALPYRKPLQPELNTTRPEVGEEVLYTEDGREYIGTVTGMYLERLPDTPDKELVVVHFGENDFTDLPLTSLHGIRAREKQKHKGTDKRGTSRSDSNSHSSNSICDGENPSRGDFDSHHFRATPRRQGHTTVSDEEETPSREDSGSHHFRANPRQQKKDRTCDDGETPSRDDSRSRYLRDNPSQERTRYMTCTCTVVESRHDRADT